MKSDICIVAGNGAGIEKALTQAEKTAVYEELNQKETLQLRLLAEELTGIMRGITTEFEAKFWIEAQEKSFQLCLEAKSSLNQFEKDQLISVAKSGTNKPAPTFMGKISRIFQAFLDNYDETGRYSLESGVMMPYSEGMAPLALSDSEMMQWSLEKYKSRVTSESPKEDGWDELEKSIVANLADDVVVNVGNKKAEIIIYKKF